MPGRRIGAIPVFLHVRRAIMRVCPPTVSAIAGIDPLRDEGLNYADQLARAGNEVTVLRYDSLPHGFFNVAHVCDRAAMAFDEIAAATRRLIAAAPDSTIGR